MKIISKVLMLMVVVAFIGCAGQSGGGSTAIVASSSKALSITTPATLTNVSSPLQVCMATNGYTVEPAKNCQVPEIINSLISSLFQDI